MSLHNEITSTGGDLFVHEGKPKHEVEPVWTFSMIARNSAWSVCPLQVSKPALCPQKSLFSCRRLWRENLHVEIAPFMWTAKNKMVAFIFPAVRGNMVACPERNKMPVQSFLAKGWETNDDY